MQFGGDEDYEEYGSRYFHDLGELVVAHPSGDMIVAGSFVERTEIGNASPPIALQSTGGEMDADAVVARITSGGEVVWAAAIGGDGSVGYGGLDLLGDTIAGGGVADDGSVIVVVYREEWDAITDIPSKIPSRGAHRAKKITPLGAAPHQPATCHPCQQNNIQPNLSLPLWCTGGPA